MAEGGLFKHVNDLRNKHDEITPEQKQKIERDKFNNTCFARLVLNPKFVITTLGIIVLNALCIGYDTDYSARWGKADSLYDSPIFFPVTENLFCVFFTFEVVVRFFAFKRWVNLIDAWWLFDATLVFFMVAETYVLAFIASGGGMKQLSILRLLRLLRITRMGKLMRFFPELQIIIRGLIAALRSVVCTAILLVLVLYVFAIIFTSEFHQGSVADDTANDDCEAGEPAACAQVLFGSLGKSMRHLFIMGTILDDVTVCTNTIRGTSASASMLLVFIVFIVMSAFTLLNMLIGILCEVVQATSEGERLKCAEARIHDAIESIFNAMDEDHSGTISRDEFLKMEDDAEVVVALSQLRVKAKHFHMYADLMFEEVDEDDDEEPTITLGATIDMIMQLRPGAKVTALDFATFTQSMHNNHFHIRNAIIRVERFLCQLLEEEGLVEHKEASASEKVPTVEDLARVPDQDIIAELHKRLGMLMNVPNSEDPCMSAAKAVEAFVSLGVPMDGDIRDDISIISDELYSC